MTDFAVICLRPQNASFIIRRLLRKKLLNLIHDENHSGIALSFFCSFSFVSFDFGCRMYHQLTKSGEIPILGVYP